MEFKHCVYINKNTPELRGALVEMGYNDFMANASVYRRSGLVCNKKAIAGIPYDSDEFNIAEYLSERRHIINSEGKETVFLAIAAINDENDYMQWFICDDGHSMFMVDKPGMTMDEYVHNYMDCWDTTGARKATADEIITHFKRKESR